jgi:hypothetical protein
VTINQPLILIGCRWSLSAAERTQPSAARIVRNVQQNRTESRGGFGRDHGERTHRHIALHVARDAGRRRTPWTVAVHRPQLRSSGAEVSAASAIVAARSAQLEVTASLKNNYWSWASDAKFGSLPL